MPGLQVLRSTYLRICGTSGRSCHVPCYSVTQCVAPVTSPDSAQLWLSERDMTAQCNCRTYLHKISSWKRPLLCSGSLIILLGTRLLHVYPMCSCAHIPGTRSPRWLNLALWRLIFVVPRYGTRLMSLFWRLVAPRVFKHLCAPVYVLKNLSQWPIWIC